MGRPAHLETARWRRAPETLWRWTGLGVVLLAPEEQEPLRLTGGGAALWDLLDQPQHFDGVCGQLAAEHGVSKETVVADLAPFFDELVERGIVVES